MWPNWLRLSSQPPQVCVVDVGQALFQLAQGLMAFNAASTGRPDFEDQRLLSTRAGIDGEDSRQGCNGKIP